MFIFLVFRSFWSLSFWRTTIPMAGAKAMIPTAAQLRHIIILHFRMMEGPRIWPNNLKGFNDIFIRPVGGNRIGF